MGRRGKQQIHPTIRGGRDRVERVSNHGRVVVALPEFDVSERPQQVSSQQDTLPVFPCPRGRGDTQTLCQKIPLDGREIRTFFLDPSIDEGADKGSL